MKPGGPVNPRDNDTLGESKGEAMTRIFALFILGLVGTAAAYAQPLEGRLKRIAETKSIAVAYRSDAMPFSFAGEKNVAEGFSIDLCKRVAASIGRELNLPNLEIRWVPVSIQSRFDAVAQGRADLECGSSTITLSRQKQVDFSNIIFVESTGLLVKAGSGVRGFSDLAGRRIAVVKGTTNEAAVGSALKRANLNAAVLPFGSRDEALAALEQGKADAFASDKLLLMGALASARSPGSLTLLPDQLSYEPYGIVLPRGDAALRLAVNTALAQVYRSGDIIDLFRRWFGALGPPSTVVEAAYLLGAIPE